MVKLANLLKATGLRWANRPLRTKGLVVISLPLAAVLVSLALITALASRKDDAGELVKQAQEVRSQLLNLYIVVVSAESAIRGYALTGHEDGLQTFDAAELSVAAVADKIKDLVQATPEQIPQLNRLKGLFEKRLKQLKDLRAYYDAPEMRGHPPSPEAISQGRATMDQALRELTAFSKAENRLLQDRTKANQEQQARLHFAITASAVIGLFGGILAVLLFSRGIVIRISQLEKNAVQLEEGRVPEYNFSGTDELGRLAMALSRVGSILSAQARELKLALEGAQILIWELELGTGGIRYQTGSGGTQSTTFPAELLSPGVDGWIGAVHAEDREAVRRELDRITRDGGAFQIEYRVVIRGGEIRWMAVKGQARSSGGGRPDRLLGVLVDITERRRAAQEIEEQAAQLTASREALQQQTRILRSILDSMGDGVMVADTDGNFLVFNPAAQEMLGSRAFAGDARRWAEHYGLFLPDMTSLYSTDQLPFVRAIRGESVDAAEVYVKPAGRPEGRWASVTARPLRQEDGAIRGGVMVMRDVTAARRTADALSLAKLEAENANQAKSEFLSRMSHELRTPLNSILGFAQLLDLSLATEQQRTQLQYILKGGYHLLNLINEILDLARIEAGRLTLSSEPVRVSDAVGDALDLVQPLANRDNNINISSDDAIRCTRYVRADRQRLKQVLLNLLSNAIKFNRAGGSVVVSCEESAEKRLRIQVADSGCGIAADGLKKIFTPFERLGADTTEVGGTGLGLALSKRLAEAMGGTIGVESVVGVGSKFYIELELLDDPAELLENDPAMRDLANRAAPSHRGTVLYIEDNPSNLYLIERVMEHCPDVRLLTAMQGKSGLDLAQMHAPNWILLDLHLPDIPGEEVLRRLRQNPRTQAIPVTVLSADATPSQIKRLMDAGAREYLTKPFDVNQLLSLLEATLPPGTSEAEVDHVSAQRRHQDNPN